VVLSAAAAALSPSTETEVPPGVLLAILLTGSPVEEADAEAEADADALFPVLEVVALAALPPHTLSPLYYTPQVHVKVVDSSKTSNSVTFEQEPGPVTEQVPSVKYTSLVPLALPPMVTLLSLASIPSLLISSRVVYTFPETPYKNIRETPEETASISPFKSPPNTTSPIPEF